MLLVHPARVLGGVWVVMLAELETPMEGSRFEQPKAQTYAVST
jgi:hypothetical protein